MEKYLEKLLQTSPELFEDAFENAFETEKEDAFPDLFPLFGSKATKKYIRSAISLKTQQWVKEKKTPDEIKKEKKKLIKEIRKFRKQAAKIGLDEDSKEWRRAFLKEFFPGSARMFEYNYRQLEPDTPTPLALMDEKDETELLLAAPWPTLFEKLFKAYANPEKEAEFIEISSNIDAKITEKPDRETFLALQDIVTTTKEEQALLVAKQKLLVLEMQKKVQGIEMGTLQDTEKLLRNITIFIDPGHGYIPGVGMTKGSKKYPEEVYTMEMSKEVKTQLEGMVYNPIKFTHSNIESEALKEDEELNKAMEQAHLGKHELSDKVRKEPKDGANYDKDKGTYTFVKKPSQDELDTWLGKGEQTVKGWEKGPELQMGHLTDRANLYGNYLISIHYNFPGKDTPLGTAKGQTVFYEPGNNNTQESIGLANSIMKEQDVIQPEQVKGESHFVTRNFLGTAAVLIEVAFMDNPTEMALVGFKGGPSKPKEFTKCATQIATGIANYIKTKKVK